MRSCPDGNDSTSATWCTFALRPLPAGGTRLLVRERVAYGRWLTRRLMAPVGLVSFVMTRKMLLGIKQRAESTTGSTTLADHTIAADVDEKRLSRVPS